MPRSQVVLDKKMKMWSLWTDDQTDDRRPEKPSAQMSYMKKSLKYFVHHRLDLTSVEIMYIFKNVAKHFYNKIVFKKNDIFANIFINWWQLCGNFQKNSIFTIVQYQCTFYKLEGLGCIPTLSQINYLVPQPLHSLENVKCNNTMIQTNMMATV